MFLLFVWVLKVSIREDFFELLLDSGDVVFEVVVFL